MSKVKMSEILEMPLDLNIYGDGAIAKANKQKKEKRIFFPMQLTQEEKDSIQARARERGYSAGAYVRFKVFSGENLKEGVKKERMQKAIQIQSPRQGEKRVTLCMQLTQEEKEFAKAKAEALGYSMSAYFRLKALED